jgi:hypothetical protein
LCVQQSDVTATTTKSDSRQSEATGVDPAGKKNLAERDRDAITAFEERFGGAADTQLGELVNGVPQGMARNVQRNMFRII